MPREYRHIEQYEKEIIELQKQGLSQHQIGERLGFRKEQIKEFVRRRRGKQRNHCTYGYRRVHIWLESQRIHKNPKGGFVFNCSPPYSRRAGANFDLW